MWPWKHKKEDEAFYHFFKNILGFIPRNTRVYQIAFIHRSQSEESLQGHRINNERLEYLGDAVLGAIVAEYLYKKFPNAGEGFLTETRSKIVSRASLGRLAKRIGLHDLIKYNRESQGVFKSMEGDAFEALVGAIYLEKGFKFTRRVMIERVLSLYVDVDELSQTVVNHKGRLIDWCQKHRKHAEFKVLKVIPKDNGARRQYEVGLFVDGRHIATAIDYTIKSAEQLASEKALVRLTQSKNKEEKTAEPELPDEYFDDDPSPAEIDDVPFSDPADSAAEFSAEPAAPESAAESFVESSAAENTIVEGPAATPVAEDTTAEEPAASPVVEDTTVEDLADKPSDESAADTIVEDTAADSPIPTPPLG